jgi:hypothetical protein
MSDTTHKLDMASLLVFEPFSGYPSGLKIRVHDKARLDSLGRSIAVEAPDGALVLDLDKVMAQSAEPAAADPADPLHLQQAR